jgi:hypothetical protein
MWTSLCLFLADDCSAISCSLQMSAATDQKGTAPAASASAAAPALALSAGEPPFFKGLKSAWSSHKMLEFAHYAQLATVRAEDGTPAVRTVRVREVLDEQCAIAFSTDGRSAKVAVSSAVLLTRLLVMCC